MTPVDRHEPRFTPLPPRRTTLQGGVIFRLGRKLVIVSMAEREEPRGLTVLPVEEAFARAKPLPPREVLAIPDVTDEEWDMFFAALAEE